MNPEITSAIDALTAAIKKNASPHAVAFRLFMNCQGVTVEFENRTPEELRRDGISMRNLAGEFIK